MTHDDAWAALYRVIIRLQAQNQLLEWESRLSLSGSEISIRFVNDARVLVRRYEYRVQDEEFPYEYRTELSVSQLHLWWRSASTPDLTAAGWPPNGGYVTGQEDDMQRALDTVAAAPGRPIPPYQFR